MVMDPSKVNERRVITPVDFRFLLQAFIEEFAMVPESGILPETCMFLMNNGHQSANLLQPHQKIVLTTVNTFQSVTYSRTIISLINVQCTLILTYTATGH